MYSELAIIGLMWSREVIHKERNRPPKDVRRSE